MKEKANIKKDQLYKVIDHPMVMLWMKNSMKNDLHGFHRLCEDNTVRFDRLFGNEKKLENGMRGWVLKSNGLRWFLTSDASGTQYYVFTPLKRGEFVVDKHLGFGLCKTLTTVLEQLSDH